MGLWDYHALEYCPGFLNAKRDVYAHWQLGRTEDVMTIPDRTSDSGQPATRTAPEGCQKFAFRSLSLLLEVNCDDPEVSTPQKP